MAKNLDQTLEDLYRELELVNAAIASVEALGCAPPTFRRSNRGRKSMGAEERQEVSERMKRYWAARREGRRPTRSWNPPIGSCSP